MSFELRNSATGEPGYLKETGGAACVTDRMSGIFVSGTLPNTTPVVVIMNGAAIPATVWVRPSADTITVSYSTDDGTNYQNWPNGAVTTYSQDVLTSGITHLKFVATVGNANNTYGVC